MEQAPVQLPDWFIDRTKTQRAVIMAGAGVSVAPPSSVPGWYALNRMIVAALGHRVDGYLGKADYTSDIRAAIDARRSARAFPPDYQAQIIEEDSGEVYFEALQSLDVTTRNASHEGIAWLAARGALAAIVTTNFDHLIDEALAARGVEFEVAFDPTSYEQCLVRLSQPAATLQVLKVHGSVKNRLSMVDTLKQRLLGRNERLLESLTRLLAEHPWIFVGFSADDLESDDRYLGLVPGAEASPGIAYVQWPGERELTAGARKLLQAYDGRAVHVVAETAPFLSSLAGALGIPPMTAVASADPADTHAQVESRLRAWAATLSPAVAVNCLATVAEAAGHAESAFRLLHRFWKDALPDDRSGADFDRYRFHHGRLGIGGGLLSAVDDLKTDQGMESLQNLLRVGSSQPLAHAWAGLAWVWGGNRDFALSLLKDAQRALEPGVAAEVRADAWLAVAQAHFGLAEPEPVFATWEEVASLAREAGDLPREAQVMALMALYHAEFMTSEYPEFMRRHASSPLARAKRLNNPVIEGFAELASGRYLTKTFAGPPALAPLRAALEHFDRAGRPPWRVYAAIEYAKALFDHRSPEALEEAEQLLNQTNEVVDRYQGWLPWYYEAAGQGYLCVNKRAEARSEFEHAIRYAEQLGLARKADSLRRYLPHCDEPLAP